MLKLLEDGSPSSLKAKVNEIITTINKGGGNGQGPKGEKGDKGDKGDKGNDTAQLTALLAWATKNGFDPSKPAA